MNYEWSAAVHKVMTAIDEVTPNAPDLTTTNPRAPIPRAAGSAEATRRTASRRAKRKGLAVIIGAVAVLGGFVFANQTDDKPSPDRVGPVPMAPATSTTVVQTTELPTTTTEDAETGPEPRLVDIADAQRLLPAIDLSTTAELDIAIRSGGLSVTSAPGLSASESPVGNDICLVLSSLEVSTGQICASAADVGGLLLFTQEWMEGNAVVALTAAGVVTTIEDCQGEVATESNGLATLTLCPTLRAGTTIARVRLQAAPGETLEVTLPAVLTES